MKNKFLKILSVSLSLVIIAVVFSSCSFDGLTTKSTEKPVAVSLKTDLNDARFSFTYSEMKTVLPADKLASLFQDYDELSDDITVELSYNDITSRYGEDGDIFDGIMGLLSDDEKAMLTANTDEVIAYFTEKINEAKQAKPITKYKESFWVDNDTIAFSQNGEDTDSKVSLATKYFSDFVTKGLDGKLPDKTTAAGDDLTDILYLYGSQTASLLGPDDVSFVVSSLTDEKETYTEKESVTDKNGKTKSDNVTKSVVTGMTRTIKIVIKNDKQCVEHAFSASDKNAILEEMKKGSAYYTVDDYETEYDKCVITATFDAVTDNILSVTYDKNMKVTATVNGVGSLEYLGKQELKFNCTDRMEYNFGWDSEAK